MNNRLYKTSMKFLDAITLEETCKVAVDEAKKLTGGIDGLVLLKNQTSYNTVYGSSPSAQKIKLKNKTLINNSIKNKIISIIDHSDLKMLYPDIESAKIQTIVVIPLINRRKAIGVLVVRSLEVVLLSRDQLNTLKLFGSMVSSAIVKAQLYHEAERALEIRDNFISMAAHELRTPLTSIHGYSQLLHKRIHEIKQLDPLIGKWIENLSVESNRLTRLVKDLLDVNQMKTGRFQYLFDEAHLTQAIEQAIGEVTKLYPTRSIKLSKNTDKDTVIGDYDKLVQVYFDLIENGVTHSPENSAIEIDIVEHNSHFITTILDHGMGINPEDIPAILEGFYKKPNREGKGFGVKLFLSNMIVKQHNGLLNIKTMQNGGTQVEIKLPKVKTT